MCDTLSEVLQRVDMDLPVFLADELLRWDASDRAWLLSSGLVRAGPPLTELPCDECGELHDVLFVSDVHGESHSYLRCPQGPTEVSANRLGRWHIDIATLLAYVFPTVRRAIQITEVIPGTLWNVGVGTWADRRWSVFFVRCLHSRPARMAIRQFKFPPKSAIFTPTVNLWEHIDGLPRTIPLTNVVSWDATGVHVDDEYVASQLCDLDTSKPTKSDRPIRKRAARTATIEALTKLMVEHVKAARDHAFATLDHHGAPELLPRPTRRELAKLAGTTEITAGRCLRDPTARELQFMWTLAGDLERIMEYRTQRAG